MSLPILVHELVVNKMKLNKTFNLYAAYTPITFCEFSGFPVARSLHTLYMSIWVTHPRGTFQKTFNPNAVQYMYYNKNIKRKGEKRASAH